MRRRRAEAAAWVVLGVAAAAADGAGVGAGVEPPAHLSPIGPAFSRTGVNTTPFRSHAVTTHGDVQVVGYYDPQSRVVIATRRGDALDAPWERHVTRHRGNTRDAHNGISLAVDGDGVLHVSWDHHGHPLRYARAGAPGSMHVDNQRPMIGRTERAVTYPQFLNLPDGRLLFMYRDGGSGSGNLVINRYDPATEVWSRLHDVLIDGEGQRNAYWQAAVDPAGAVHLSWVWRESGNVASNHDLAYAVSRDAGTTWTRSDGTPYALPITEAGAELACRIPQNHELINQTSMAADAQGRPYIAAYWRAEGDDVPQLRLVVHDGDRWVQRQVGERTTPFRLGGHGSKHLPLSRPQVVVGAVPDDAEDADELPPVWVVFRDGERGDRVSVAAARDGGRGDWQVQDLTDTPVGHWEPSYDRARWKSQGRLDLFVQPVFQVDSGGVAEEDMPDSDASVLSWTPGP